MARTKPFLRYDGVNQIQRGFFIEKKVFDKSKQSLLLILSISYFTINFKPKHKVMSNIA